MPIGKTHKRPVKRREVAVARSKRLRDHKMEWNSELPYFEHHYRVAFDFLHQGTGNPAEVLTALKFLDVFNKRTARLVKLGKRAQLSNQRVGQPLSEDVVQELKSEELLHNHLTDLLNEYKRLKKK